MRKLAVSNIKSMFSSLETPTYSYPTNVPVEYKPK